jgi:YVTN family beta-propeller protein
LWVVNTRFNTLFTTIPVGLFPFGVAVTPDGSRVYVTNQDANTVSVIDPGRDIVTGTIGVGSGPVGVDVTPDGKKVYVGNGNSNGTSGVSVIDAATNTVVDTITTGQQPVAFGKFIQPKSKLTFAGTPGKASCHGQSVSALVQQFGGLNAAATASGYPGVSALQIAIMAFCED